MPNGVKYSTTTPSGSLRRGNVALGVTSNLGPTANTGFYSMPAPQSGKYIINKVSVSGIPNFFAPADDTELIRFARIEGATGADTGSAAAVLAWMATQPNLEAVNFEYENIVTNGLVYLLDAGFISSYPTTGITWYELTNNVSSTLNNGPTFNSANSGSIVFDGTNDYALTTMTVEAPTNSNLQSIGVWLYGNSGVNSFTGTNASQQGACHFIVNWSATNQIRFAQTWYGGSPTESTDYATVTSNASGWNYMVAVKKAVQTYDVYFNGSKVISDVIKEANISTSFQFGTWWAGMVIPMSGISIVQSYNRALSATEITQNYNAQKSRFGI